jgi:CubicO group peptidase (beta-lactamase class C family)
MSRHATQQLAHVDGFVAPGFECVRDAFERNFAERNELGAAFAAERDGEPIVDLWGGIADRTTGTPWTADTIQLIFSGTKGLVAVCMLLLLDRGVLDLATPVSHYWPEFAAAGKQDVRLHDVVAHTARLPGLETTVSWQEATDPQRMAELLAAQPQSSDPRAAVTYHALTYGWLCAEILRRVDGRTIGRFFAVEVAMPLGLELWIGLPAEFEPRVATLELADAWGSSPHLSEENLTTDTLLRSVFANPVRFVRDRPPFNERAYRAAEIPATNGIGTARSIAHMYGNLERLMSRRMLELARRPLSRGRDTLLDRPRAYGIGFQLQTSERPLGPPPKAFGHGGAGGSVHGYWPKERIAFSYAMNLMRDDLHDTRAHALLGALQEAAIGR